MTGQAAQPETASRSLWTTALIAAFGGPFAGFLWIGAGRLAIASLVVVSAISFALMYVGFPVLPGVNLTGLVRLFGIGLMILWAALVVPFAHRYKPIRWYSHGLAVLLLAVLTSYAAAFTIPTFLFQPFSTRAGSMLPTLELGDYFFVSKTAYGYGRYSVPLGLLQIEGRVFGAAPKRGDVVVFRSKDNDGFDYVKRVIGLPGDRIQIKGGVVHINGTAVGLEDIGDYSNEETGTAKLQRETLPEGISYNVISITDNAISDDTREFTVPSGEYFVLGDNRDNSRDSRFTLGTVPYGNLVGKAVRLFWNSNGLDYSSRQVVNGPADR
jgi:signal peptidase I